MRNGYVALILDNNSRAKIFEKFTPKYPDVFAHHITLQFGIAQPEDHILDAFRYVFEQANIQVIGYVADDKIEALVVEIDGVSSIGNQAFHVTLSLDRSKGAKPVHSKKLIEKLKPTNNLLHPIQLTGKVEFISN